MSYYYDAGSVTVFEQSLVAAGWTHIKNIFDYERFRRANKNAYAMMVRAMSPEWQPSMTAFYVLDATHETSMISELARCPHGVFVKLINTCLGPYNDTRDWYDGWDDIEAACKNVANYYANEVKKAEAEKKADEAAFVGIERGLEEEIMNRQYELMGVGEKTSMSTTKLADRLEEALVEAIMDKQYASSVLGELPGKL